MKSLISILLAMLMALNPTVGLMSSDSNLLDSLDPSCEAVVKFIDTNFALFIDEYHKSEGADVSWNPSFISEKVDVTIFSDTDPEDAILIIFDNENGYALIGDNYLLYDFQTTGISPFNNIIADSFFFSVFMGYGYFIDDKPYSCNYAINTTEDFLDLETQSQSSYNGQESGATGCGKITNTDSYISSRYGSGWNVTRSNSLAMTGYSQTALSCYYTRISESSYSSEGNCWVVSAYTVLQYYADKHTSNSIPKSTDMSTYNAQTEETKIYNKHFYSDGSSRGSKVKTSSGSKLDKYFLNSNTSFPTLWTETRKYVNNKYGKIDDGSVWQTANIIENVAYNYELELDTEVAVCWNANLGYMMTWVDNGNAFLWSTASGTYGSHTMAGCGYKMYTKTTKWWIFVNTDYKIFLELRDGHTTSARYFDIQAYSSFGAFIFVSD